jgi:transcriptional regulator with XRE-family HTH domain
MTARTSYPAQSALAYHQYDGQSCYTLRDLRWLCRQWLTYYRLQRGLSIAAIAQQVGLSPNELGLLELGKATTTLSISVCTRLGEVLSNSRYSAAWIATIIAGACGYFHTIDEQILHQIRIDLTSSLPLL